MKRFILFLIRTYKKWLSPILTMYFGHACRFTPTCSEYAYQAISKYGMQKGVVISLSRISKCHPLSRPGYDPLI